MKLSSSSSVVVARVGRWCCRCCRCVEAGQSAVEARFSSFCLPSSVDYDTVPVPAATVSTIAHLAFAGWIIILVAVGFGMLFDVQGEASQQVVGERNLSHTSSKRTS